MSWYSKVVWSEGLFLRPHHLQQDDRYSSTSSRAGRGTSRPIPGAFAPRDRPRPRPAEQVRVRRAAGVMPDGAPFDVPGDSPPARADRRAGDRRRPAHLAHDAGRARPTPARSTTRRPESASRYVAGAETVIDSTSKLRIEEEIDVAYPRLTFEMRKTAKPGYVGLAIARIVEVRDKHDRLRREIRAAGAGLRRPSGRRRLARPGDRLDRQQARRARPLRRRPDRRRRPAERRLFRCCSCSTARSRCCKHFRRSSYVHPERLYEEFLRIAGELATFATPERRAREYPRLRPRRSRKRVRAAAARHPGLPQRPARPPRHPAGDHRARAERFVSTDPRPHAVPQRHLRPRSRGAPAADRDPERSSRTSSRSARTPR